MGFCEGIDGWYYDATSSWNNSCAGKDNVSVAWDEASQSLKASVDYSKDIDSNWSQLGINFWTDEAMDLSGVNNASFDLIYNPENRTMGTFSVKAFTNAGVDAYVSVDEAKAETTDEGMLKIIYLLVLMPLQKPAERL